MNEDMKACIEECKRIALAFGEQNQRLTVPDFKVEVPALQAAIEPNFVPDYVNEIKPELLERINYGEGLKIAVIDTGCDQTHHESGSLQNVTAIENFTNDRNGYDFNGHGSWCLSAIGGSDRDGNNMNGLLPKCTLYSLKGLSNSGSGSVAGLAAAILYAVRTLKVDAINCSFGGSLSRTIEAACIEAEQAGVIIYASIGNSGSQGDGHPGNSRNTVGVGAMDNNDNPADFTSWSQFVEITDRGVNVIGAAIRGRFWRISGTSMSGPIAAAKAAWAKAWLRLHYGREVTRLEVEEAIFSTVRDIGSAGWDNRTGNGQINPSALAAKYPISDTPTDPTPVDPPVDCPEDPRVTLFRDIAERKKSIDEEYNSILSRLAERN